MANFDMGAALAAKASTSSRITPGVHTATFVSVAHDILDTKNGPSEVLKLTLDIEDHGEYTQSFFKPSMEEGRKDGQFGPQPAPMENFQILLREILEAVNPDFAKDIQSGDLKLSGSFKQIVNSVAKYLEQFSGKSTFAVKFMPQSNGYASIPTFVAGIARDGKTLRISNTVLGKNVTLTPSEEKKIRAAALATPTNMAKVASTADVLASMGEDLGVKSNKDSLDIDDMPF